MLTAETINRLRTMTYAPGVIASVDGQYGSTGKGVINGVMGQILEDVDLVITNAGPNSGHTNFFGDKAIILKQLPTFGVTAYLQALEYGELGVGRRIPHIRLSAGAVINPSLLVAEMQEYGLDATHVSVHRNAAVIDLAQIHEDKKNVNSIASTGQGVGPAIIEKMSRSEGRIWGQSMRVKHHPTVERMKLWPGKWNYKPWDIHHSRIYLEVSQGYSLGINSGFYPHTTSRECTVSQAMADAQLPPNLHRFTIMSVRTYPIRVGDTQNTSGPCYPDQVETSWEQIGVEPEYTTVTKRKRRVFTWSKEQFADALLANDPDVIFLNFCNYLKPSYVDMFVRANIIEPYYKVLNRAPMAVLLGHGPKFGDVTEWEG